MEEVIQNSKDSPENREFNEKTPQGLESKRKVVGLYKTQLVEDSEFLSDYEGNMKWPIMDQKALHGFAGEFVDLATQKSEADPAAVLATLLVRLGVEVGHGIKHMIGDTAHYPLIYSVIVGASSKARKGTSAKPVMRLFDLQKVIEASIDINTADFSFARDTPGPLSSGEGIINEVRDELREWKLNKKTGEREWVVTDPGFDDKRLMVLDEEFGSALTCTKREGNTLSAILRNLWDSGSAEPLTKSAKIKTTDAHVGICTHITLEELNQKFAETEAFNGFANRFLWVCARRGDLVPFPEPMGLIELSDLRRALLSILSYAKNITEMHFSQEAKQLWGVVYEKLSMAHSGLVGSVINRAEVQVKRLSMLYAILDKTDLIEKNHLEAALAFWDYCEASAKFIFSERQSNRYERVILNSLQHGPRDQTALHKAFNGKAKGELLNRALKALVAQGRVCSEKFRTGGKPKTIYRLSKGKR